MGRQSDDRSEPWVSVQRRALRAFPRIANRYHRRREPTEDPRGAVPRGRDAERTSERDQIMTVENKHRDDNKMLREFYQRIELREPTGEILPACMGLLFEIADCVLQPVPPRYKLAASRTLGVKNQCKCVD